MSFFIMGGGFLLSIPIIIIYISIIWVFSPLSGEAVAEALVAMGTENTIAMGALLTYPFSICLYAIYCDRDSEATTRLERLSLQNQIQRFYGDQIEIEARVSKLVDRLEDEALDPDDHNVDLDTVELMNDIRSELEDIRDKLS